METARPSPRDFEASLVLDALPVGAFVFDSDARLVFINREAVRMFGFRSLEQAADELEGRSRVLGVVKLDGSPVESPLKRARRALAGQPDTMELERVAPLDGRAHVILRTFFRPIVDANGRAIGAVKLAQDVTGEYELTRRKEEFVRITSHELRTPTTVLRLAAQRLLRPDAPLPAALRSVPRTIERATRRIESIASKLIDIATIASGEAIPLALSSVRLDEVVADAIGALDDAQASRVHLTRAPACVRADAIRVREVIEALLDNALRYSPAGATVDVSVGATDDRVELSVTDHGVGIPESKRPHIFEQFYRAHTNTPFDRGGLGASLYLSARIVEQHGGRIWFDSSETGGTTFHVRFEPEASARREGPEHAAGRPDARA